HAGRERLHAPPLHDALPICTAPWAPQGSSSPNGTIASRRATWKRRRWAPTAVISTRLSPERNSMTSPIGESDRAIAASLSHKSRSEEHTSELQSRFDLVCRL